VLDWELAHLGDFHLDLAWATQRLFGALDERGEFLVAGLMPRAEFLERYEKLSRRSIDPEKLHYYEVLNAWKCAAMQLGPGVRVPLEGNSHQDLVLSWLASAASVLLRDLVAILRRK
jgi:aminoglycoside phosphotransferase (APT) family kinase protein